MFLLNLNLQYFSQDDPGGSNPTDDESVEKEGNDNESTSEKEITLTQSQLDKMMSDREKRALIDKEKAIKEAEKLAKMNAEQKREYEFEKLQKENEELRNAQNRHELGKEATRILSESGIVANDDILDFVVRDDAEQTSASVQAFTKMLTELVDVQVKEKLRGTPPKKQQGNTGVVTKEDAFKMGYKERLELKNSSPELYKQYFN